MVLILLPNLPTLSKLITQFPQKEIQILISFREGIFKGIVYFLDRRVLFRFRDLLLEQRKILLVVLEICGGIEIPAGFKMPDDDFDRGETLDKGDDLYLLVFEEVREEESVHSAKPARSEESQSPQPCEV